LFDLRLGLALGKSLSEIRRMSYSEYREWVRFYTLEPWGWQNAEYILGSIVATLYNVNRTKGKKAKTADDFMRKPEKEIDKLLARAESESKFFEMTEQEKKTFIRSQVTGLFGG
jgi:hypothetical protein